MSKAIEKLEEAAQHARSTEDVDEGAFKGPFWEQLAAIWQLIMHAENQTELYRCEIMLKTLELDKVFSADYARRRRTR